MKTATLIKFTLSLVGFALSISFSNRAEAWGNRGHATVCEAALFLVKEKGLRQYLQQKPNVMGHLCNIPDTYWKGLGSKVSKLGNPTHFTDVEILGIPVEKIPLDYKTLVAEYTGKKNAFKEGTIYSIPTEFGSNWWRADQFFRRAVDAGKKMKAAKIPAVLNPEHNDETEFNKSAYEMILDFGLMGHFVGDNGQPLHSTADYDGYSAGHGGLHSYFEDGVVAAEDGDLLSKVIHQGQKFQTEMTHKKSTDDIHFLKEKTVLEKMRALAALSRKDIAKLYELDPVIEKSIETDHKGFITHKPAKRPPAETVAKKMEPLLVTELARSATLLAELWDQAYLEAGSPDFNSYRSYKYPFTPDFVAPDYFDPALVGEKK